jgi:hypothetical protein
MKILVLINIPKNPKKVYSVGGSYDELVLNRIFMRDSKAVEKVT